MFHVMFLGRVLASSFSADYLLCRPWCVISCLLFGGRARVVSKFDRPSMNVYSNT